MTKPKQPNPNNKKPHKPKPNQPKQQQPPTKPKNPNKLCLEWWKYSPSLNHQNGIYCQSETCLSRLKKPKQNKTPKQKQNNKKSHSKPNYAFNANITEVMFSPL